MLENLRKLREESAVTQKQLAEVIGVSQQSINKYENHNIEPDIETLIRMAKFFNTSVDFLIGHNATRFNVETERSVELCPEEDALIRKYRRLTPRQKYAVSILIDSF